MLPLQEGGLLAHSLNTVAAPQCDLQHGVCGGATQFNWTAAPMLDTRMQATAIFQKNLNHFFAANPGYFAVEAAYGPSFSSNSDFVTLHKLQDSNTTSLTTFSTQFHLTVQNHISKGLIRVRYVTNNPNAPKQFVQCSPVVFF